MTALLEAFRKSGLKPTQEQPGAHRRIEAQPTARAQTELPDLSDWDDAKIENEAILYEEEAADIKRQMDEDLAAGRVAGFGWRGRANGALKHKTVMAKCLRAELRRRHSITPKAAKTPQEVTDGMRRHEEFETARRAARLADIAEQQRIITEGVQARRALKQKAHDRQDQLQNDLFVKAARAELPHDTFVAIWQRAREMHPDDPCWDAVV
jgi:hypothetical protein